MSAWRSVPVNLFLSAYSTTRQRGSGYSALTSLRKVTHQSQPTALHRALHTTKAAAEPLDRHQQYSTIPRGHLSAVPIVYHEVS